jgi:hypothetical protein
VGSLSKLPLGSHNLCLGTFTPSENLEASKQFITNVQFLKALLYKGPHFETSIHEVNVEW